MQASNHSEKIKDIQAQCEIHWLVNRIPQDRAEEMADELGQHLEEAVQDGKTVEDVVGPDVYAFAESWAEEDRPVWTVRDRVVEYVSAFSFGVSYAAVAFHLLNWTLFLSVHWSVIPILVVFAWPLSRLVVRPEPSDTRPLWRRWLWPAAAVLLIVATWLMREELRSFYNVIDVAITGNTAGTLFTWPWYGTVFAVVVSVVVGRLNRK